MLVYCCLVFYGNPQTYISTVSGKEEGMQTSRHCPMCNMSSAADQCQFCGFDFSMDILAYPTVTLLSKEECQSFVSHCEDIKRSQNHVWPNVSSQADYQQNAQTSSQADYQQNAQTSYQASAQESYQYQSSVQQAYQPQPQTIFQQTYQQQAQPAVQAANQVDDYRKAKIDPNNVTTVSRSYFKAVKDQTYNLNDNGQIQTIVVPAYTTDKELVLLKSKSGKYFTVKVKNYIMSFWAYRMLIIFFVGAMAIAMAAGDDFMAESTAATDAEMTFMIFIMAATFLIIYWFAGLFVKMSYSSKIRN